MAIVKAKARLPVVLKLMCNDFVTDLSCLSSSICGLSCNTTLWEDWWLLLPTAQPPEYVLPSSHCHEGRSGHHTHRYCHCMRMRMCARSAASARLFFHVAGYRMCMWHKLEFTPRVSKSVNLQVFANWLAVIDKLTKTTNKLEVILSLPFLYYNVWDRDPVEWVHVQRCWGWGAASTRRRCVRRRP